MGKPITCPINRGSKIADRIGVGMIDDIGPQMDANTFVIGPAS